ncbi:MAG: glycosyltransferase [Patescibacteria group bacterium]
MRVSIVLPALNEAENLSALIDDVRRVMGRLKWEYEVIIVDDGSTDATPDLLKNYIGPSIRVIQHPRNRGYGAALRSGFAAAHMDWVFLTDADRQFRIDDIEKLAAHAAASDFIIGYRVDRKDHGLRKFNTWLFHKILRVLFGVSARDVDCAFKLMKRDILQRVPLRSDGAFISTEIFINMRQQGHHAVEVPIPHYPRLHGTPSGARLGVIARAIKEVLLQYVRTNHALQKYAPPLLIFLASRVAIVMIVALLNLQGFGDAHFGQWDARLYLIIAEQGYIFGGEHSPLIAFFPLYPLMIRIVAVALEISVMGAGLALSLFFGAAAALVLYELMHRWKGREVAMTGIMVFSLFPTSIFLTAPYTESLFLLLALLTFFFLQQKQFSRASLAIALALVTRVTGFLLLPVLWYAWYREKKNLVWLGVHTALILIPFGVFLLYQKIFYGTPFAFLNIQKDHWHHEATWPWIGLQKFMGSVLHDDALAGMWRADFALLAVIVAVLIAGYKIVPRRMLYFGWAVVLLTLSQTYILGMSRYLMMVIPFYFFGGYVLTRYPLWRYPAYIILGSMMIFNTILFTLSKHIF